MLPTMTTGRLPLPDRSWPKARRYMRALRRGVLSYWYATIEDGEAAAIEAATATWYVNILDEAVFQPAHGTSYEDLRANDRLGQVVMGLELIRNCETHASVVFDGLLVGSRIYGVPLSFGGQAMRSVFKWAEWDELPLAYRDVSSSAMHRQKRARAEAQHAYRQAVQTRQVTETLFDAMAFFQSLDERLVGPSPPPLRWAFTEAPEIPDTDPSLEEPTKWYLARPLGLDAFEPFLPDLACRTTERLTAQWPAADRYFKAKVKQARRDLPSAPMREIQHVVIDNGKVVGYSGIQPDPHGGSWWIERCRQVWQDVRQDYRYFVNHSGAEIDVRCAAQQRVHAPLSDGRDVLADLPEPTHSALDFSRLMMAETYPDVYLEMRISRPIG
jgi:hypothetical protein